MREINWGITLGYGSNHFKVKIGNNFRLYKLSKSTIEAYDLQDNKSTKIFEPRNLMYSFIYYIKSINYKWNTAVSVTNFDFFLIQQETNPMIMGRFHYNIKPRLRLYSELWYQSAGLFNIHVNYFGFYFRTGVLWQIEL